ncbi:MAG: prepilin-type N-terminal cleavage/methylation domain-containing protein [Desulfobacterales bacterium]|nr:prepilin-type N-terminal cleavage/methylation domain-containing protein [Desulfobacterales bacterium]
MRRARHEQGFTLLELLISLTILAVIVGLVSGALSIGIRAWEKGERGLDIQRKQRIVLDLMKRQLAAVSPGEFALEDDEAIRIRGDEKILELVSDRPLSPKNTYGKVYARYEVTSDREDGDRLVFYEKNIALLGEDFDPDHLDEDLYHELLSGARRIRFEYLKPGEDEDDEPEWQDEWSPEDDEGSPRAVRINYQESADAPPVQVIARIVEGGGG